MKYRGVELKHCPFCGEPSDLRWSFSENGSDVCVRCGNCLALGPEKPSKIAAMRSWNGRWSRSRRLGQ